MHFERTLPSNGALTSSMTLVMVSELVSAVVLTFFAGLVDATKAAIALANSTAITHIKFSSGSPISTRGTRYDGGKVGTTQASVS